MKTALTALFTVDSYCATLCWSFVFLSWGMPYLSGSWARVFVTSSLAAASRTVAHAPSLGASRKVLFL